jgi:hypothetical protein
MTKKEEEREVMGILSGRREGEVLVKNIKPKLVGGEHEVIERKIEDSVSLHEEKDLEVGE